MTGGGMDKRLLYTGVKTMVYLVWGVWLAISLVMILNEPLYDQYSKYIRTISPFLACAMVILIIAQFKLLFDLKKEMVLGDERGTEVRKLAGYNAFWAVLCFAVVLGFMELTGYLELTAMNALGLVVIFGAGVQEMFRLYINRWGKL
jgi:hypothetical protein